MSPLVPPTIRRAFRSSTTASWIIFRSAASVFWMRRTGFCRRRFSRKLCQRGFGEARMGPISRRGMLGVAGAALATPAFAAWPLAGAGMPKEGPDTPHICLGPIADAQINPTGIRRYTQLGLTHIILNGSGFPWNAGALKQKVATLKDNGLTVGDIGLPWSGPAGRYMRDIIYARPGRDKAIEDVKASIRAAGAAGIPIVEYNFYVHRANEGYFDHPDPARGNAGVESFDYARMKDARLLDDEIVQKEDDTWAHLDYFLK